MQSFTLKYDVSGKFSCRSSISCWESSLLVLVLWEFFKDNEWILYVIKYFFTSIGLITHIYIFKSSIVDYVDSFSNVEPIIWDIFQECKICLPFEYKSLLVIVHYQFLHCWIWFAKILFRIFLSLFIRDIGL